MALITTIEQFRKYVKLSATSTTAVVLPDFDIAENKHLLPILGQELYNNLLGNVANAGYARLLELSRGVIAPMALYYNLAFLQGNITDTGIKVMSSDTMQSAPKWVNRDIREALLEKASLAAEVLITYLLNLPGDAAFTWNNTALKNSLYKSGSEFCNYHFIYQPYRTFLQLVPVINEVEDNYIKPTFGDLFYSDLKATPNYDEKKALLELIRKAVANLTISKAIESLTVKTTVYGFTVKMADDVDDPYKQETQATDRQLETKRASTLETGSRYLVQAKNYADSKASAEIFTAYFNSDKYVAPASVLPPDPANDDNAFRNGVFAL